MDVITLPPRPQEPLASDCCGNGCNPCVLDIYQEELVMWEYECDMKKKGEVSGPNGEVNPSKVLSLVKDQYTRFTIDTVTKETHDTIRVRFILHKSQALGLSVGQHVVIRATSPNGLPITRQYTPISPVQSKGYFEFILKVYSSGVMSHIIKLWQAGDTIDIRGPMGNFIYTPNKHRRVLMLCAGTGIAPMCQVIHAILDNEDEETLIRLVYACKNYTEILAQAELAEWRRYWNFSCIFVLSQEPVKFDYTYRYGEEIRQGHIDDTMVTTELGDHPDKTLVLICGTSAFDSDMLRFVKNSGVLESSTHKF